MIVYTSISKYLESAQSIKDKIDRLDVIILAMMTAMEAGVLNGAKGEYRFDDGQVKIEEVFRDPNAMVKTIEALEKLKDMYRVRMDKNCNGSVTRLVDGKNFI
jgi:uncharacterized protein YdeI (BOF family)